MNKRKKIVTTTTTVTEEFVPDYTKTHIICVLDRSGSMEHIMDDSIGGFNAFIKKQKELPDAATISVYIFDKKVEQIRDYVDIKDVKLVTKDEWYPCSTTALYDAIGIAINSEKKHIDVNTKVLVCIVTDGRENDSKEYTQHQIKTMIGDCEKNDWTFLYLAANQDACLVGKSLGFSAGNTYTYIANTGGVNLMSQAMNSATVSYRSNTGDNSNLLGNNTTDTVDGINDSLNYTGTTGNFIIWHHTDTKTDEKK